MTDTNENRDILDVAGPYPDANLPKADVARPRVDSETVAAATADHGHSPQEGGYFLNKFLAESGRAEPQETAPESGADPSADTVDGDDLEARIVAALQEIYDPEIPVNIYELGLIYGLDIDAEKRVTVTMTLTTPHCPVAESMPGEVELKVNGVPGVNGSEVKLVWEPAWDMSKMSDEARLELGLL